MSFFNKLLGKSAPAPKAAAAAPDDLQTLTAEVLKVSATQLQAEIAQRLQTFRHDGIEAGRHAEKGTNGLIYGAYLSQEHLTAQSALSQASAETFGQTVASMSAMFVHHIRLIRHLVHSKACDRFYVNSLREVLSNGLWCILLNDQAGASFIQSVYYSDQDPKLAQALEMDPEVDALFDLTLQVSQEGPAALATFDADRLDTYQPLLQALQQPSLDATWLNHLIADRQRRALAGYVRDTGEGTIFTADLITALFPLEIIALLRACHPHRPIEVELTDPFAQYLWNLGATPRRQPQGDLATICGFVAKLTAS